ncbi:hypothetical protein EXW62_14430 [Bacillus mycoides]|nr:hypothetical protein EXW62_14430 [Bacillus mycoides]
MSPTEICTKIASTFYFSRGNIFNRFPPHHNRVKQNKYPKNRKLASPGEKVHFSIFGCYKILTLMGMGSLCHFVQIVRLDTIWTKINRFPVR